MGACCGRPARAERRAAAAAAAGAVDADERGANARRPERRERQGERRRRRRHRRGEQPGAAAAHASEDSDDSLLEEDVPLLGSRSQRHARPPPDAQPAPGAAQSAPPAARLRRAEGRGPAGLPAGDDAHELALQLDDDEAQAAAEEAIRQLLFPAQNINNNSSSGGGGAAAAAAAGGGRSGPMPIPHSSDARRELLQHRLLQLVEGARSLPAGYALQQQMTEEQLAIAAAASMSREEEERALQVAQRMALFQSLPTTTHSPSEGAGAKYGEECVICMIEYQPGDQLCFLPCLHLYHRSCIRDWFARSLTCPICGQSAIPQEEGYSD